MAAGDIIAAQAFPGRTEFFHATVVRKKLLTADEAERAMLAFRAAMPVVSVEYQDVAEAVAIHRKYQTRYWDSLILATAAHHKCSEILSERHGASRRFPVSTGG